MALIIIATFLLIPHIGYTRTSDLAAEQYYIDSDVVPEIEIIASRLTDVPMDSIGAMPGIIVYGERPSMTEKLLIQRTQSRNKLIINLSGVFSKYALFGLVALFTIVLSIVAVSRAHSTAHIHASRPQTTSSVHKYYVRHRHDIEREMQRYLAHLIGNSK